MTDFAWSVIIFFTVLYASKSPVSSGDIRVVTVVTRGNMLYAVSLFGESTFIMIVPHSITKQLY